MKTSDFYIEAYSADSSMFGFQQWCKENKIEFWSSQANDRGILTIYFKEDTDMMAAKLRWL